MWAVVDVAKEDPAGKPPEQSAHNPATEAAPTTDQPSSPPPGAVSLEPATSEGEAVKQLKDDLLRLQAEKSNQAKRTRTDLVKAEQRGIQQVVSGLLEVVDSLELSLKQQACNLDAIKEGVRMTLSQLQNIMTNNGIETIEPSQGSKPDLNLHAIFMQEASDVAPPNMIIRTEIKGYRINQRILRPAQVVVALAPDATDAKPTSGKTEKHPQTPPRSS